MRFEFDVLSNARIQLDRFRGTFAPFLRASERPMAIACLRLLTRPPFPPGPERSVPRFRRCIALLTVLLAAFPYLGISFPSRNSIASKDALCTFCF